MPSTNGMAYKLSHLIKIQKSIKTLPETVGPTVYFILVYMSTAQIKGIAFQQMPLFY